MAAGPTQPPGRCASRQGARNRRNPTGSKRGPASRRDLGSPPVSGGPEGDLGGEGRAAAAPLDPRVVPGRPMPRVHRTSIVVLLVVLVVIASLAASAWVVHDNNEDRLLHQRVREASTIFSAAVPSL